MSDGLQDAQSDTTLAEMPFELGLATSVKIEKFAASSRKVRSEFLDLNYTHAHLAVNYAA